jgi:hypothetical protein
MVESAGRRGYWWGILAAIIAAGLLSRALHTGYAIFDKYLGDALYAAMVYVLLRLTNRVEHVAIWSSVAMVVIELFQLTGFAAGMLRNGSPGDRVLARLLGTEFSMLDLTAYGVGIAGIAAVARLRRS